MALLCATMLAFAQTSTLTATLKHGDNITAFYGIDAFVEAHEAAVAGDVITLSSGTFNPPYINRAITLRGAGCVDDPELSTALTSISGRTSFNVEDGDQHMTIEGIHFTDAEFAIAFPKEETYCEATEDALANIILKHNDREQEYLRLYKGRKPTKVAYFTICDDEIVEEGSELMNDILRYVPKSGGSAKQEALGIRNIVEVKQPKIENVILLAQSDNIFINPDFEGLANHIMENLENIFKKK